jgi:hypothetical protein
VEDEDEEAVVFDLIDDPVITDPNPVLALSVGEFFAAPRTRIKSQPIDLVCDPRPDLGRKVCK